MLEQGGANIFFMIRALIDSGIVFMEGVPEAMDQDAGQWNNLARQGGETFAEIVKEFTAFEAGQHFDQ